MATKLEERDLLRPVFGRKWFAELWDSLQVMYRVVFAIIIREARTRYGSSQIGYAWALVDPVIILLVFVGIFSAMGRVSPIPVPAAAFFLTGIMPFFYWRGAFSRSANAVSANLGLLAYPQVMPVDIIIGRTILEAATSVVVFFVIATLLGLTADQPISVYFGDPVGLVFALGGLLYFTLGFSFLSAGLGRILPVWTNITVYIGRPLFLTSGLFFTLEQLPTNLREILQYNPVAHQIEWIRSAAFESFESSSYSIAFVLISGTVALLIGLVIDRILMLTGDEEIVS